VYAAGDAEQRKRLLKEARTASALKHPSIVTLHDVVIEDERDALVMEYVARQTLQEARFRVPGQIRDKPRKQDEINGSITKRDKD
jgi:serine/threonine protein kinase